MWKWNEREEEEQEEELLGKEKSGLFNFDEELDDTEFMELMEDD